MPRGYAGEAASPRAGDTADVAHAGVDHLRVPPVPPRHSRVRSYLRPCLVPRHRGGELVLKGDVGVVAAASRKALQSSVESRTSRRTSPLNCFVTFAPWIT